MAGFDDYQLLADDENQFQLLHPDGSSFSIAKAPLTGEMHQRISNLPAVQAPERETSSFLSAPAEEDFAKSGQQWRDEKASSEKKGEAQKTAIKEYNEAKEMGGTLPNTANRVNELMKQTPEASQEGAPTEEVVKASPKEEVPTAQSINSSDPDKYLKMYQEGFGLEKASAQNEAKALAIEGQQKANALNQALTLSAELQKHTAEQEAKYALERGDLEKALREGKIDPNRYWGDMSTGNKVLASVAIALGGIGQGLMKSDHNMALDVINNAIARDMDAQKVNLNKAENLLRLNYEKTRDMRQAELMTQNNLLSAAKIQVEMAGANSQGPIAEARKTAIIGGLTMKQAEIEKQLAEQKNIQVLKSGKLPPSTDPSILVPHLVPKEHQKEVFHEIKQAQDASRVKKEFLKAFDTAGEENTVLRTGGGLLRTPPSIKAMNMLALPLIHDLEGRVNEFEQKTVQDNMPKPGDLPTTIARKRQAMDQFLSQKESGPTAKGYGIDLSKFQSTSTDPRISLSPEQMGWLDWANKNPNAPEAKALKKKLGIQ